MAVASVFIEAFVYSHSLWLDTTHNKHEWAQVVEEATVRILRQDSTSPAEVEVIHSDCGCESAAKSGEDSSFRAVYACSYNS